MSTELRGGRLSPPLPSDRRFGARGAVTQPISLIPANLSHIVKRAHRGSNTFVSQAKLSFSARNGNTVIPFPARAIDAGHARMVELHSPSRERPPWPRKAKAPIAGRRRGSLGRSGVWSVVREVPRRCARYGIVPQLAGARQPPPRSTAAAADIARRAEAAPGRVALPRDQVQLQLPGSCRPGEAERAGTPEIGP